MNEIKPSEVKAIRKNIHSAITLNTPFTDEKKY